MELLTASADHGGHRAVAARTREANSVANRGCSRGTPPMAQHWRILRNVAICGTVLRVGRVGPTFRRWAIPGHRGQRQAGRGVGGRGGRARGGNPSAGGLVHARVQRGGGAPDAARFTGIPMGSPAVPRLNVGSSILLARFQSRRWHTMPPAVFRWHWSDSASTGNAGGSGRSGAKRRKSTWPTVMLASSPWRRSVSTSVL